MDTSFPSDGPSRWSAILALFLLFPLLSVSQPLQNRLLIAVSSDGLAFKKLDSVLYNFADVPDAVVSPSNHVFVYFQGILEPYHDRITVGDSPDGLGTWSFQIVTIAGTEQWPVRPCDPDVVYRDGLFRLYFTGDPQNDKIPETYSATSTDGIHFTLESGVRFSGTDRPVLDPSLLWVGDTLHYFAGGASPTQNWHAISLDGLQFRRLDDFFANGLMMSNGIAVKNGYRFYGFPNRPPPEMNIQSIFSPDGSAWSPDPGIRLERDPLSPLEGMYVKDPAVIVRDSTYIMYYVTRKPEYSGGQLPDPDGPLRYGLSQNYPNPFNPSTLLRYQLPAEAQVRIAVYDFLGREVAMLVNGRRGPGDYDLRFEASGLASGVYLCRLVAGEFAQTRKMILLR